MPFINGMGPSELIIILAMVGVPVLVLLLVIPSIRAQSRPPGPDPRVILAERLARGEITGEEFDTAMRALGITDTR